VAPSITKIVGLLDASEEVRGEFDHRPAPDSIAADETSTQHEYAGEWSHEPIDDCRMMISMLMVAAEFHMWGYCDVLRAEKTGPNTLDVLARATIENLARAVWLSDPGIGRVERIKRSQTERLYSAAEEKKLGLERSSIAKDRQDRILATAAALGWPPLRSRKGWPPRLVDRPTATSLAGQLLLDNDERGLGQFLYRLLSASSHGTTFALARFIHPLDDGDDGRTDLGVLAVDANEVKLMSQAVVMAYVSAMRAWLAYQGWDGSATWQKSMANSLDLVRPD